MLKATRVGSLLKRDKSLLGLSEGALRETEKQYNNVYEMAQDIRSGNGSPIPAPPQARDWAARQALAWWGR